MKTKKNYDGFETKLVHLYIYFNDKNLASIVGTFPASGLTKNITACSAHFDGDCCKNKYQIQVKNCTGFYVYKLVPTSACPQAYCFGLYFFFFI